LAVHPPVAADLAVHGEFDGSRRRVIGPGRPAFVAACIGNVTKGNVTKGNVTKP